MPGGIDFATRGLGHAFFQMLVDGLFVAQEPLLLGFKERDCAGDDFSRITIVAEIDFTLDALFGDGIEVEVYGMSISRGD